jgi:hypothetical protein
MAPFEPVGLRRLKEVCHQHGLPMEILPPEGSIPATGASFLGQPFDPILSVLYSQMSGAMLGDFQIYPFRDVDNVVLRINEGMRISGDEPYASSLLFGQIPLLAYYLATAPSLADSAGIQPVIFIDGYEGDQVLPVASSVDAFFMTFSRYLERAVAMPEFTVERRIRLHFPRQVPDLISRDRTLVAVMSAGGFDRMLNGDESREWVAQVVAAAD